MKFRSLVLGAALAAVSFASAAQAAIPRATTNAIVRIDGRRVQVSLTVRAETPVVSAVIDPENAENSGVYIVGGTVEVSVALDMLDNQPLPEGLTIDRVRLVRATPDSTGRRTWNPAVTINDWESPADQLYGYAQDGPPWEAGARVEARVRLVRDGQVRIVELGRLRIGGDFTLAP